MLRASFVPMQVDRILHDAGALVREARRLLEASSLAVQRSRVSVERVRRGEPLEARAVQVVPEVVVKTLRLVAKADVFEIRKARNLVREPAAQNPDRLGPALQVLPVAA